MAAPSFKVIFNDCYGGFQFSAAFEAEYRKRTGWDLMTEKRLFRNGPESVRRDSVAIALLEEKGTEWSSGTNSYLAIRVIPALFERYWSIEDYDGNESVYVNVPEAYADLLHVYMGDGDHAKLTDGYRRVRSSARALTEAQGLLKPAEVGGALTDSATKAAAPSTDVSSSRGYSFFDTDVDSISHD
jgi:hypothetical protein